MIPKLFKVISGKYVDDTLNYLLNHQGGGMQMNKLESDLTFVNGTSPSGYFPKAFYYTDNYEIKYNNGETIDTIFGTNEVVYWNPDTLTWVGSEKCMIYNEQSDTWSVIFNQEIERINLALSNKQNTLTAGTGISIVNNVISSNAIHNYSTTERVVGTWTNGKPLYEKVITGTTPNVSTEGTSAHSEVEITESTNIDECFITNAFVKYSNNNSIWSCPYYNNDMKFVKAQLTRGSNQIWKTDLISNGTVYNNCSYKIIVNYTKTTD